MKQAQSLKKEARSVIGIVLLSQISALPFAGLLVAFGWDGQSAWFLGPLAVIWYVASIVASGLGILRGFLLARRGAVWAGTGCVALSVLVLIGCALSLRIGTTVGIADGPQTTVRRDPPNELGFLSQTYFDLNAIESEFMNVKAVGKKLSLDLHWDTRKSKSVVYVIISLSNLGGTEERVVPINSIFYQLESMDAGGRKAPVVIVPPILLPRLNHTSMVLLYPKNALCGVFAVPRAQVKRDRSYRVAISVHYNEGTSARAPLKKFHLSSAWSKPSPSLTP